MIQRAKVIHFSITPLAGSPIRIVNALNKYTVFKARHVVLWPGYYGSRVYETDLVWQKDKAEILEILHQAEIVHLHHFIPLEKNEFGINFNEFVKRGVRVIRQFHSDPETICRFSSISPRELLEDPLPQLVISQYHERYFPKARLVPNIVPLYEELYLPQKDSEKEKTIFFAPTSLEPGFSSRWGSKGAVETLEALSAVAKRTGARIKFLFEVPHEKCLREKRKSRIAVDDMVSGSFHVSSLESLAQGIPTFAYLDARVKEILFEITGTSELPWMNFHLNESKKPAEALLRDEKLCREISVYSRAWMERYWNDSEMIKFYVHAYNDLLETPGLYEIRRFNPDDRREIWFIRDSHDEAWQSRQPRWILMRFALLKRAGWTLWFFIRKFFKSHD